jgi:hypothetical protein
MGRLLIATFGDSKPFGSRKPSDSAPCPSYYSYITARFLSPGLLIALMMEAARTSETLVNFYQTTRYYNPEDSNLETSCLGESNFLV